MNIFALDKHYFQNTSMLDLIYKGIKHKDHKNLIKKFAQFPIEKAEFEEKTVNIVQNIMIKCVRTTNSYHGKLGPKSFMEFSWFLHDCSKMDELLTLDYKPFLIFAYQFVCFFNLTKLELCFDLEL